LNFDSDNIQINKNFENGNENTIASLQLTITKKGAIGQNWKIASPKDENILQKIGKEHTMIWMKFKREHQAHFIYV